MEENSEAKLRETEDEYKRQIDELREEISTITPTNTDIPSGMCGDQSLVLVNRKHMYMCQVWSVCVSVSSVECMRVFASTVEFMIVTASGKVSSIYMIYS